MEVKLVVVSGQAAGREIPLPITMVMIGRGKQCHLRPHCRLVSKLHCAVARWAGKVVVRDLKSSNGTFINGARIQGEARVKDGDVLQVGTVQLAFKINESPQTPLPVQVVLPSDVRWLMESGDGSSILKTSDTCSDVNLAAMLDTAAALPAAGRNEPGLSAGDYLHEYFRQREASR